MALTQDTTHKGKEARIEGRQGLFIVHAHETNPRTGAAWWCLFGPVSAADRNGRRERNNGQWVHVRDIKLVAPKRATRRRTV